jgi:hypothetical protein
MGSKRSRKYIKNLLKKTVGKLSLGRTRMTKV